MLDLSYSYSKVRSEFGKQCFFSDDGPKLVQDLRSDRTKMEDYIYKNPISRGTYMEYKQSWHDCNTNRTDTSEHGMLHMEGGWPKEINPQDEEQVDRFRKKIQREDNYVAALRELCIAMEHDIQQNNAVNIYQTYFDDLPDTQAIERSWSRIKILYRDPLEPKRPIKHLSWAPDGAFHYAVTHCNMEFQRAPPEQTHECFIWDVENPNGPILTFLTKQPICVLEYGPRDPHSLVAGLYSGQVAFFDVRRGPDAVDVSKPERSHREACHSVLWTASKSGTEFFSTSSDGQVKWWDSRKLEEPLDHIILDLGKTEVPTVSKAHPASCLEFDPSISAKYMVGTENGSVIAGNRKGANQAERLPWIMKAHLGPIHSIQRNQGFAKNYLSVGDWTARIWSEDCKESCTMWTNYHKARLTSGEWSPARNSVYFLTRADGVLDLWDILQQQNEATISQKICSEPLTCLRVHEDGKLVIVGNTVGTTYLVEYSDGLASNTKNDRQFLAAMFDREARREKVMESRNREIRYKFAERMKKLQNVSKEETQEEGMEQEEVIDYVQIAQEEYFAEIKKETADFVEKTLLYKEALERTRQLAQEEEEEEEENEDEGEEEEGQTEEENQ